jgi:hypothetical protein
MGVTLQGSKKMFFGIVFVTDIAGRAKSRLSTIT